ncbi:MAG: hypothetical protein FWG65_05345 [Turicibacter sp.]|nr:hypothetical protein [Turicibacter sp.]
MDLNNSGTAIKACQDTHKWVQENYNFGYTETADILSDLQDEINELHTELHTGDKDRIASEIGDIAFVLCNLANKYGVCLETALEKSTAEYQQRLAYIREKIGHENMCREKITELWADAKNRA